jgi:tRNA (guanine10-N2)-dimethyltransferase
MQSLLIFGRQPELSIAEVESLYGPGIIRVINSNSAILDIDPCLLAFDRLGGSIKFAKVLTTLNTDKWPTVKDFLINTAPEQTTKMAKGKMTLGISLIGFNLKVSDINKSGYEIKKAITKTGRNVRYVPHVDSLLLSSAQVIHNKLTGPRGWELIIIKDGKNSIIGQTIKVQDIKAYSKRDYDRPRRDTKVGMLPPKLAQIMINLASGKLSESTRQSICEIPIGKAIPRPKINQTLLDPFCGTGVILQEALLMGYDVYGTDINSRMVDYSKTNIIDWLVTTNPGLKAKITIKQGDATNFNWSDQTIDLIASETYLGPAFNQPIKAKEANDFIKDCNDIITKFLSKLAPQIKSGFRICLAVPAWRTDSQTIIKLPFIDQLDYLGYNEVKFKHAQKTDLIYLRPNQTVARQLLVLTRK